MWHLTKSEFLRFRTLALVFAAGHFMILRLMAGSSLFVPSMLTLMAGTLLYPLGGLLFGLYQIGTRKKLNQWTYLIHRPLSPRTIFAAMTTAAVALLALVFALPLLLMTLYLDVASPTLVDARQYLLPLFVLGTVLAFHWVGSFIMLSPSRAAFLVVVLPLFFVTREAEGARLFLVQALVLIWLGFLVSRAFKPDLSTSFQRPTPLVAQAVALGLAWLVVLTWITMMGHQTWVAFERHGWRSLAVQNWSEHFPDGTFEAASYATGADAFRHGLAAVDTERARHLQQQVALAEVHTVAMPSAQRPRRHQLLVLDETLTLDDAERNLRWTFSHDTMRFYGQNARSGQPEGWLGTTGRLPLDADLASDPGRFAEVPRLFDNRYVLTPTRLFTYDADRERLDLRFEVAAGETLVAPFQVHPEVVLALSDRALFFFEPRDLEGGGRLGRNALVTPTATVALPGALGNLSSVHVAELIDSYVVSFLFGTRSENGYAEARQVVGELSVDGQTFTTVADRPLAQGWSAGYRNRAFILSPVGSYLHALAWGFVEPRGRGMFPGSERATPGVILGRAIPSRVLLWALVVGVLSALCTTWQARDRGRSTRAGWAWTLAALVAGPAAYLAFIGSTPRRVRPPAAVIAPAPALRATPGVA